MSGFAVGVGRRECDGDGDPAAVEAERFWTTGARFGFGLLGRRARCGRCSSRSGSRARRSSSRTSSRASGSPEGAREDGAAVVRYRGRPGTAAAAGPPPRRGGRSPTPARRDAFRAGRRSSSGGSCRGTWRTRRSSRRVPGRRATGGCRSGARRGTPRASSRDRPSTAGRRAPSRSGRARSPGAGVSGFVVKTGLAGTRRLPEAVERGRVADLAAVRHGRPGVAVLARGLVEPAGPRRASRRPSSGRGSSGTASRASRPGATAAPITPRRQRVVEPGWQR